MSNIPSARRSPRLVNGVIYWYEGNTFEMTLKIDLQDQDGEPIDISGTDSVEIVIKNSRKEIVKIFEFSGESVDDNRVLLDFDATVTALFRKGKYTYDIYYNGEKRTSLADNDVMVVE